MLTNNLGVARDAKYVDVFWHTFESVGVKIVLCPQCVPQCNAYAERFVRSIKEERLRCLILMSEQHLRTTISSFADFYRLYRP